MGRPETHVAELILSLVHIPTINPHILSCWLLVLVVLLRSCI